MNRFVVVLAVTATVAGSALVANGAAATQAPSHVSHQAAAQPNVAQPNVAQPNGSWTWWGYRTNSYQTWGVATHTPSWYCNRYIPAFACAYVYGLGWIWHFTAQNARRLGQCLGINWSGTGLIVGCSRS